MLTIAWLLIASVISPQPDTTLVLGLLERDLTGDGEPETLRVVGVGPTTADLDATFTIESAGATIYRFKLERLTRTVGFDAGGQVLSAEQHRARLANFRQWFFAEEKFQRPTEFVDRLRVVARARIPEIPDVIARDKQRSDRRNGGEIWEEILKSRATIFTFSPGGDALVAIGWSASAGRFYRLLECC
jgi:hypothetical protein